MKSIPIRQITTDKESPKPIENFRIRELKELLNGRDMVQDVHRHDFYFVLVLEKGRGSHAIDFVHYPVHDGAIFILRPGQVHQLTLKKGSEGYLMEFRRDFLQGSKGSAPILDKVGIQNHYQPSRRTTKKITDAARSVLAEYREKGEQYQDAIRANLEILLIELLRYRNLEGRTDQTADRYAQDQLEKLLNLIETHISTHKQVSQYADLMNLSAYQVNSITKTLLGKTCSALIDESIILEARRYLLATANQVSQVAYLLGYSDVSYFIRFFKKHTGHTPEAFRLISK